MFILWWLLTYILNSCQDDPLSSQHQSPDFLVLTVSSIPHNNKIYGQSIQDDSKDIILSKANIPFDDAFIQSLKDTKPIIQYNSIEELDIKLNMNVFFFKICKVNINPLRAEFGISFSLQTQKFEKKEVVNIFTYRTERVNITLIYFNILYKIIRNSVKAPQKASHSIIPWQPVSAPLLMIGIAFLKSDWFLSGWHLRL